MLTKAWLGLAEHKREDFAEELVGEGGNHGADGEKCCKKRGCAEKVNSWQRGILVLKL